MDFLGQITRVLDLSWIDQDIPSLIGHYRETSPPTDEYNCIAWAVGDNTKWWSHNVGYEWPVQRTPLVAGLVALFKSLGFEKCDTPNLEIGFVKVALYEKKDCWTHAARQLESGKWTCKLGPDEDIEHDTAEALCPFYGSIHCFMKRAVTWKAS